MKKQLYIFTMDTTQYSNFVKGGNYIDIIEENTQHIFGHNNILTDYLTKQPKYIYNGLTINVNLCFFYLYNDIVPLYLINTDELCFPNFEYIIDTPPLGKDDNDVFLNKCKKEFFLLFDFENINVIKDSYKGYIFIQNEDTNYVYVFFHLSYNWQLHPSSVIVPRVKNIIKGDVVSGGNHNWALISEIIKHTPLSLFHWCPLLATHYKNIVFIYGSGKREYHPVFGYFYYFIYDSTPFSLSGENGCKAFLFNINTKRFIDVEKCKNNEKLLEKSLLYESFWLNHDKKMKICIKDFTKFMAFE